MARSRHKSGTPLAGAHRLVLAAALVVGAAGVGASAPADDATTATAQSRDLDSVVARGDLDRGQQRVSRSAVRHTLTAATSRPGKTTAPEAEPEDLDTRYVTTDLNVRTGPSEAREALETLSTGTKVRTTGRSEGDWAEIRLDGDYAWVSAAYLSADKPEPVTTEDNGEESSDSGDNSETGGSDDGEQSTGSDGSQAPDSGGISQAPCPSGSSVEDGLTANAIAVHRAVCAQFPQISSYGGLRPGDGGEHGQGRALDIMVSDSALGDQIAEYVRANAGELGVSEVIWSQHIWTVERSSEGWRPMEDRGSPTANHYDHVHVTVY